MFEKGGDIVRKQWKRVLAGVTMLGLTCSLIMPNGQVEAAKKASLATKKMTIQAGKKKAIVIKNKKKGKKYQFSSNKKKVAKVSAKGMVNGIAAGNAVITVKEKAKKGKAVLVGKVKVKVTKNNTKPTQTKAPGSGATASAAPQSSEAAGTTMPASEVPTSAPSVAPADAVTPQPTEDVTLMRTVYVAPDGSDEASGKKNEPVQSLAKAKEIVRTLSKTEGDITVEFADGFYPIKETVMFTSEDSGTKDCKITYCAAEGATPVLSGGQKVTGKWEVASDVNWLKKGLVAYKVPFERNEKLRALYVNGERAAMTRRTQRPDHGFGDPTVTKGEKEWAWVDSSSDSMYEGCEFDEDFELSANTRNPQNIELESGSTWAKQVVCAERLEPRSDGNTAVYYQFPYAALAQNLGWGTPYSPTKANDVTNVFEWLENPGEFYFDQAGSMLYYIPKEGEDINTAEVVVPETDTLVDLTGDKPKENYVENITFEGLTFAYTDWNLYELDGSHGYASVQGAIVLTKFANINQHDDIYRSYDVPPAAIHVTSAKNIKILDGEIRHTGYLGVHLENDVVDCEVTGNYIAHTGGAGIVVGHPTHVYENDTEIHKVKVATAAGPEKEKFKNGTEAVPKNIALTNNYLYENCYFFPGNSPITTFFTQHLEVLHNFVYKCSYSGMSIGWGWCNFDGAKGADSQLPGVPTTTSRDNHVNYNRVEEICSLLQDAGGIYSLGQQGNDDWTEASEMNENYINCKRAGQKADGSRMVNGFHPDEGSAYIKFDKNVITNTINNVYELNNFKRKHDLIVTNGFSNTDRSITTAPNCSLDQYVNKDCIWPLMGYMTVLNSGLEDKYVHMVGKDVIPDTDYELASNVRLVPGQKLPRRGLLTEKDEVWLAPEGTTAFAESDTCTKAAGNEKEMDIPGKAGEYKLYIRYADGTISKKSTFTLSVGDDVKVANVEEGQTVNVSKIHPYVLELSDDFEYTLNGEKVVNGYEISTESQWELIAKAEQKEYKISFKSTVTIANKILVNHVTVKPGETVIFDKKAADSTKTIWLAPSGVTAFDEKDATMTKTDGMADSIVAPSVPGEYAITVVGPAGDILSRSDALVTVKE